MKSWLLFWGKDELMCFQLEQSGGYLKYRRVEILTFELLLEMGTGDTHDCARSLRIQN